MSQNIALSTSVGGDKKSQIGGIKAQPKYMAGTFSSSAKSRTKAPITARSGFDNIVKRKPGIPLIPSVLPGRKNSKFDYVQSKYKKGLKSGKKEQQPINAPISAPPVAPTLERDNEWIDNSSHRSEAVELVTNKDPVVQLEPLEISKTTDFDEASIPIAPISASQVTPNPESDNEWIDLSSHPSEAVELVSNEDPGVQIEPLEVSKTTDFDEASILIAPISAPQVTPNPESDNERIDFSSHQSGAVELVSNEDPVVPIDQSEVPKTTDFDEASIPIALISASQVTPNPESDNEWIDLSSHPSEAVELVSNEDPGVQPEPLEVSKTTDFDEASILIAPISAPQVTPNPGSDKEWIYFSSYQSGAVELVSNEDPVVPIDQSEVPKTTDFDKASIPIAMISAPQVTPNPESDNEWIYFSSRQSGAVELVSNEDPVVQIDQSEVPKTTDFDEATFPTAPISTPPVSPNPESDYEWIDHSSHQSEAVELAAKEDRKARINSLNNAEASDSDVIFFKEPVIVVLGHVDAGKTKLLDKIRNTKVQKSEAHGITQQIGATRVTKDAILRQCNMVPDLPEIKIPGFVILDTPGHEHFYHMRSTGASSCDLALLVIDITRGFGQQTIDSINLLKEEKIPFIIVLNKIDRIKNWESNSQHFNERVRYIEGQFQTIGLNACLYYKQSSYTLSHDDDGYFPMVPISAQTGEGMGNLLAQIVQLSQTAPAISKRIIYSDDDFEAIVLEVKPLEGYGTTIDVILRNGKLCVNDTIVLAGVDGPIVTEIRSMLLPPVMKDSKVKNKYTACNEVRAAQGLKVVAKDLEKAIAGGSLFVAKTPTVVEACKNQVNEENKFAVSKNKFKKNGVCVQASTFGSLLAILELLDKWNIPYRRAHVGGTVLKNDVIRASTMQTYDEKFAVILAFDVKEIAHDVQQLAKSGAEVKIFTDDSVFQLVEKYKSHCDKKMQQKREEYKNVAVFPCKLKIKSVITKRNPLIISVKVIDGILKVGTPLCVVRTDIINVGKVLSMELNNKSLESANKNMEVSIKIDSCCTFGRQFNKKDELISLISRESIDACKQYFREDLDEECWNLTRQLKKIFQILGPGT